MPQTVVHLRQRDSGFARAAKKIGDQLVEFERGGTPGRIRAANIDATALVEFHPFPLLQLAITRTHGVGVQVETTRHFARARQSLPRLQFTAQNSENDLGLKLIANADFASTREPELHGELS